MEHPLSVINPAPRLQSPWLTEWLRLLPGLRRVAVQLTRDRDEAEDLLQETAVRAHRFAHSFRAGTSVRAWLHRILRNTFASRYRKRRREREVVVRAQLEGTWVIGSGEQREPAIERGSMSDEVLRALDSLPRDFRAVLVAVVVDGLSYRQAADTLGCPIGTVMSRLHRARAAMVAALAADASRTSSSLADLASEEDARVIAVEPMRRAA